MDNRRPAWPARAIDRPSTPGVFNAAGEGFCMTVDGDGAPHQSVFAEQLVQKLMPKSVGDDVPDSVNGTVWGPKIFSPINATYPDDLTVRPDLPSGVSHGHSRAAILRPWPNTSTRRQAAVPRPTITPSRPPPSMGTTACSHFP